MSDAPYSSLQEDEKDVDVSTASSRPSDAYHSTIVSSAPAVRCRRLCRSYGNTRILHSLNLTVPAGSIYALLGPSGCGKTTLLHCLTGRLKAHSGSVLVLGAEPNTPGSSVPGESVGYMPQELALYEEFSIAQNFLFYGKLFGMTRQAIDERTAWLLDFLHIPASSRSIKKLSGGQRRRVSLACALLHSPPLLLLDEPTVGVDPLLRSRIWSHLATLSQQGTTIIITTHYIEEARQAHYVGFMRNGRILEEGQPDELIGRYEARTLEDVFLKLCTRQEEIGEDKEGGQEVSKAEEAERRRQEEEDEALDEESGRSVNQSSINATESSLSPSHSKPAPSTSTTVASYLPRWQYLSACIWRNLMRFRNNLPALLFVFLLPSIQICLFCIAIGRNPSDLPFGVVNRDPAGNYSARYVDGLVHAGLDVRMYDSESQARTDGRANEIWGYSVVPANYTRNLQRLAFGGAYDDGCIIRYAIDQSDFQIAAYLTNSIVGAYTQTVQSLIPPPANSTSSAGAPLPLQADEPLYGTRDSSFTDFIAPGMIITIAFSQSIGLTALVFVVDSKSGVMDRGWSAGIRANEVMLSHSATQLLILTVQIWILLFFGQVVFELPMEGSIVLVFVITLLLAFAGVMYGLVIAAVCSEERQAMQLALGSFFPALLLSGVIWPVQAIPPYLRWMSLALPTTWAASAGRDVMSRGWGLADREVWLGVLVIAGWNVLMFAIAATRLRTQK